MVVRTWLEPQKSERSERGFVERLSHAGACTE